MNDAYDLALRTLHLVDGNDPLTEIVAKKIIDIHKVGVSDPAQIAKLAIKELGLGRLSFGGPCLPVREAT